MKTRASLIALILGASSALLAAPPAAAVTIVRDGDRIVLTGTIQPDDDAKFAAAVGEAMKIGRLIRRRHLDTAVPSSCMSACALIWAGGVRRSVDGRLAMHCPTFPGELQCYAPTRQVMVDYLKEMGAPTAVVELQEAAGSTSSLWVEPAQLLTEAAQPIADEGPRPEEDSAPTSAATVLRANALCATARLDHHPQRAASNAVLADVTDVRRPAVLYLTESLGASTLPVLAGRVFICADENGPRPA